MDLSIIRIILLASSVWGVYSLEITNLTVPDFVQNGTQDFVLLDCDYEYGENDTKLVVKWFHDNDPKPIYQWIPEYGTFATTNKFGDRVSTHYDLDTGNNLTTYRALHMLRPTTEMTGRYSCQVTSMETTATKDAYMTIYAKPESVSIDVTSVDNVVNVVCIVEDVFPVPEIEMFHIKPSERDYDPVEEVYLNSEEGDDAFDVFVTTNMSQSELSIGLHFFGCAVSLEGAGYKEERRMPFSVRPIRRRHRPGLRRKILSEDGMLNSNDPEVLHLEGYGFMNPVAEEPSTGRDDPDDDGAFNMRSSVAIVVIFVSALLVLIW